MERRRLAVGAAVIFISVVAAAGVALGIAEDVRAARAGLVAAGFGAAGGAASVLLLLLVSRGARSTRSKPYEWLLVLVVGSGPFWSALNPSWESLILGYIFGFIVVFVSILLVVLANSLR